MRPVFLMLLATSGGCAEEPFVLVPRDHPEDTGEDGDVTEETDIPEDTAPCVAQLEIYGPDKPRVGDEWLVWMRCDELTITGAGVLRFDPPELATVDVNLATFILAGEGLMTMQVGTYKAEMDITIAP